MMGQHDRRVLLVKEVILRVFAHGLPITIGLLGFILGWWEKLSAGGGTNRNRRRPHTAKFRPPPGFPPKTWSADGPETLRMASRGPQRPFFPPSSTRHHQHRPQGAAAPFPALHPPP